MRRRCASGDARRYRWLSALLQVCCAWCLAFLFPSRTYLTQNCGIPHYLSKPGGVVAYKDRAQPPPPPPRDVAPEEPLGTPLGNTLKIRQPKPD